MCGPHLNVLLQERDRNGRATGMLTFKHKDGSHFPGEISLCVFVDANGNKNII
ncbi:MAG: hypothetical protein M3413_02175 [Bacteroidota bacterium]|nr:hypothetical protein [Bacteroidota bacterium]